jgi:hypothetical protein
LYDLFFFCGEGEEDDELWSDATEALLLGGELFKSEAREVLVENFTRDSLL